MIGSLRKKCGRPWPSFEGLDRSFLHKNSTTNSWGRGRRIERDHDTAAIIVACEVVQRHPHEHAYIVLEVTDEFVGWSWMSPVEVGAIE